MTHHVVLTPILIGISLKTENLTLKQTLSRPIAHKQQRTVIVVTDNLITTSISFENYCLAVLTIKNNFKPHFYEEDHLENDLLHTKDFHIYFTISTQFLSCNPKKSKPE